MNTLKKKKTELTNCTDATPLFVTPDPSGRREEVNGHRNIDFVCGIDSLHQSRNTHQNMQSTPRAETPDLSFDKLQFNSPPHEFAKFDFLLIGC